VGYFGLKFPPDAEADEDGYWSEIAQEPRGDISLLQVIPQFSASAGVTQLAQHLGFDLPDSLPGYIEFPSYFFQGLAPAILKPKPELELVAAI